LNRDEQNIDYSDITEAVVAEPASGKVAKNDLVFINEFDDFDNLSDISGFPGAFDDSDATQMVTGGEISGFNASSKSTTQIDAQINAKESQKLFGSSTQSSVPQRPATSSTFIQVDTGKKGLFSGFDSLPLQGKSLLISVFSGVTAAVAIAFISTRFGGDINGIEKRKTLRASQAVTLLKR